MSSPAKLDARMRISLVAVAACGAIFTVAAAFVWGAAVAISVAVGAAIAASNLYVLARIVAAVLEVPGADASPKEGAPAKKAQGSALLWGLLALVKMLFLFGGIWLLMTKGLVLPIPLVAGYGSLPIGIAIGSLVSDKAASEAT